jgi:hypothetical protein
MSGNPGSEEEKYSLVKRFEESIRQYREDVSKLSAAPGSLEFDAFQKLLAQCGKSHQTCVELLCELAGLE